MKTTSPALPYGTTPSAKRLVSLPRQRWMSFKTGWVTTGWRRTPKAVHTARLPFPSISLTPIESSVRNVALEIFVTFASISGRGQITSIAQIRNVSFWRNLSKIRPWTKSLCFVIVTTQHIQKWNTQPLNTGPVSIVWPSSNTIGLASTCNASLAKKVSAGFAYPSRKMEITLAEGSVITAGRWPNGKSSETHPHDMHRPNCLHYLHYCLYEIVKVTNF